MYKVLLIRLEAVIGAVGGSRFLLTTLAWSAGASAAATEGFVGVVWGFNGTLTGGMVTGVAWRYEK